MALIMIEEPRRPSSPTPLAHLPLFRLGFRPFYLLAAVFAAISVPLWVASYFGLLHVGHMGNLGLYWHTHEMVFGFAIAVIIGFLYTAGRNWTGLWTPRRGHLAALAGLWIAGRVAMLFAAPLLAALIDMVFLPLAAWSLYRVLRKAGNKRNLFLVGLLGLLTIANATFHGAALGWLDVSPVAAIQAAILVIVLIESVIGGRVIPGFTANAVPGTAPVTHEKRDRISLALTASACLGWVVGVPAPLLASLAIAAACTQILRVGGWKPHRTLHNPLLWILHLSYAWIPIGFVLLGLAALDVVSTSAAFHALAVGSMAGLIIGMMTRTALGHTGRPLRSGFAELVMYVLIQLGVIARVLASFDAFGAYAPLLIVAALCWSATFLLYVAVYAPYLMRARLDGRDG